MYETMDTKIHYVDYGNKNGTPIVFLHGWGQNIAMLQPLGDAFKKDYRIIIVDLSGHGASSEPPFAWELTDFVDSIHNLLTSLKVQAPILVGHSFGGKISIIYASKYGAEKLVLLASPFKVATESLSNKTKLLKSFKKIPVINKLEAFAKKHIGSADYRNASQLMRQVMVNHVNTDVSEYAKKIKAPTLIIWGECDEAVPIADAYELEALIKDAGVVKFAGCTHYAYLERINQTISVLTSFFGG